MRYQKFRHEFTPGGGGIMRSKAKTFEDLFVWQKAHEFVLGLYKITAEFPTHETYGLRGQMRRAGVSIPANIAEGFKKRGRRDKARFLNIAQGSIEESRYYLILTRDLGYADTGTLAKKLEEVSCLLDKYYNAIMLSVPNSWILGFLYSWIP